MFFPEPSSGYYFILVGCGLLLYLGVYYLNRQGNIQAAVYLLSIGFNIEIFINFQAALMDPEIALASAIFEAYLLGLAVMLSGMLISNKAPFAFALTNIAAVFLAYQAAGIVLRDNISYTANLGIFLFLVAVISWLYQKSLDKANERLLQMGMIQRDLEIASEVQKRLFPDTPQLQNNACLNGYVQPARETSGDFYDFIHLGADEMGILVADVTGKSMAAALMMTMTRSILRNEASSATSPAQVLAQANQTLLSDTAIEQMVTVWYGVFNTRTYVFRYSNAGHPFALLKRQGRVEELQLSGFPLGAIKEAVYNNQMTRLEPDDTLILFSDGIPEAMNPQNEMFGFDRLQEALRHAKGSRPEQIKEAIWQSVIAFQQGAEQLDDMTLVVIHIDGKDA
ncbi:MAG: hypothetical protein B6243_12465 [Anaerolineaceae bacterium 4572_5.2]|nr:MAG: hypothetical protein B6243_12465 [Anaerolineaceae bacterium 4572_5.2]